MNEDKGEPPAGWTLAAAPCDSVRPRNSSEIVAAACRMDAAACRAARPAAWPSPDLEYAHGKENGRAGPIWLWQSRANAD